MGFARYTRWSDSTLSHASESTFHGNRQFEIEPLKQLKMCLDVAKVTYGSGMKTCNRLRHRCAHISQFLGRCQNAIVPVPYIHQLKRKQALLSGYLQILPLPLRLLCQMSDPNKNPSSHLNTSLKYPNSGLERQSQYRKRTLSKHRQLDLLRLVFDLGFLVPFKP